MLIEIAHAAETESGILGTFGLDWRLFIAQLINFAVIVFVLTKWVYRPLMKVMDERKKKIEEGVNNAELAKRKLGEAKEAESRILREARVQAQGIVAESKEKGDAEKQRRIDASKAVIDEQLIESKNKIAREAEEARRRVKKEMAELVLAAAEKTAKMALDEKGHRKAIDESIRELETHG
jgi:F-type H+-transporting ATPase subunit b